MRYFFVVGLFLLGVNVHAASESVPLVIEPGVRIGPVTPTTSESDLRQLLGANNVVDIQISVGEGEEVPGTAIYPNDVTRRAEVLWKDDERNEVDQVIIRGSKTQWRTLEGITLGTPLSALENLNGGPVHITGFEWDYSGTVTDAAGGKLQYLGVDRGAAGVEGRVLLLRLDPPSHAPRNVSDQEFRTVTTDRLFLSSNPVIQRLDPSVYEIVASF